MVGNPEEEKYIVVSFGINPDRADGNDQSAGRGFSRRIEYLMRKAAEDPGFAALLLEKRGKAANEIKLALTSAERQMLDSIPREQLEMVIANTDAQAEPHELLAGPAIATGISPRVYEDMRRRDDEKEMRTCLENLRLINRAKIFHKALRHKQPDDPVTWEDLVGDRKQLPSIPHCPVGGEYTIGAIGHSASCSVCSGKPSEEGNPDDQ